ncbi:ribonuclease E/G [Vibrio taketomensis]|uniref:ribonuclease E/G n=1 Tax=Vibrio taketomensis TaxID=2572923 RepID=UPI0038CDAC24
MQEIHVEREAKRGIVGNIYKGKVSRVLPGMQAAFVDIGLDKAAFLHASDIVPHTECVAENEKQQFQVRDISELVRQGQDIVVQVVKDPLGTKGARLTTDITLPSRYLVFMPGASHVGVSQRIESESERDRLKKWLLTIAMKTVVLSARLRKVRMSYRKTQHFEAFVDQSKERRVKYKTRATLYGSLAFHNVSCVILLVLS